MKRVPVLALLLAALCGMTASAQDYPSKPIRFILPSTPGSLTDIVARAMAPELTARMGQTWVVDNRAGGNQVIGIEACARAPADGYTVCMVSIDSMSLNPHTMPNLPYNAATDFRAVTNLFFITQGLLASGSLPANSVKELQALARAKPGSLNFATLGPGTNPDVFRHWLAERWRSEIVGVPYKGGAPITTALLAGEVQLTWLGVGNVRSQLSSGKAKVLVVNGARRSRVLPNVPTLDESGLDGFPEKVWWGLAAPVRTSDAAIARLNAEVVKLYQEPKFIELLENQFLEPAPNSPDAFASFMKADRERAAAEVKLFNVPKQ